MKYLSSLQLEGVQSYEELQQLFRTKDYSLRFECGFAKPDRYSFSL